MKSITGFILSLVGAILSICLSIVVGVFGALAYIGKGALVEAGLSSSLTSFAGTLSFWLILFSIWFLLIGILGSIFSSKMIKDESVRRGGIWCLILGIIGINLFMVIGGSIGMMARGGRQTNQAEVPTAAKDYVKAIQQ